MQDAAQAGEPSAAQIAAALDGKTKPQGSLGRLEALAAQIAALQGRLVPKMKRAALTIFAADHGIAAAGVSAFPQDVTGQMVANFLAGGAAANVIAQSMDVPVTVVDCGVRTEPDGRPGLVSLRLGAGTANSLHGPAMAAADAEAALDNGLRYGAAIDADAVCFGEMGIANTSSATLLAHKLTGIPVAVLAGRGTGLDDEALMRKTVILERAAARTGRLSPRAALAEVGGFEIGTMAGAMLGAARKRRIVIVDGFIAGAAALLARALEPRVDRALIWSHRSAERGHGALLDHVSARPLFDFDMRLGEGTGALLAWPTVRAAAAIFRMASFADAGVTERR
ncbi:nicotinate-nucleotide--dimethylbenzimidazole phosphoribosyltransferase [Pacificimonas flava]|uniref:Nicotinate-nucleotide--dimethylbenzimidazole phosphoribosyltransferase n=1 Tax=Pacificimonas flava TaxID=1234595 RepID=M2TM75_9SPHN|nr:nicotinate-nucleotide--dimethylbenzimidazole phosphoribosyltransferase [Pacificimonas flava]EMD82831.1 Nicotinate-nucleotide--dimethylbenzimidazole phosphoribosyltransferase [Pacificimonas flava]MBB5279446.1 nicotinate-nucleotide--dimethylbenzimidazole phosphoribosyltransferase [Pacificimonas flava]